MTDTPTPIVQVQRLYDSALQIDWERRSIGLTTTARSELEAARAALESIKELADKNMANLEHIIDRLEDPEELRRLVEQFSEDILPAPSSYSLDQLIAELEREIADADYSEEHRAISSRMLQQTRRLQDTFALSRKIQRGMDQEVALIRFQVRMLTLRLFAVAAFEGLRSAKSHRPVREIQIGQVVARIKGKKEQIIARFETTDALSRAGALILTACELTLDHMSVLVQTLDVLLAIRRGDMSTPEAIDSLRKAAPIIHEWLAAHQLVEKNIHLALQADELLSLRPPSDAS